MILVGGGEQTGIIALVKMYDISLGTGWLHLHVVDVYVIPVIEAGDGILLANQGEPVAEATFNMN